MQNFTHVKTTLHNFMTFLIRIIILTKNNTIHPQANSNSQEGQSSAQMKKKAFVTLCMQLKLEQTFKTARQLYKPFMRNKRVLYYLLNFRRKIRIFKRNIQQQKISLLVENFIDFHPSASRSMSCLTHSVLLNHAFATTSWTQTLDRLLLIYL